MQHLTSPVPDFLDFPIRDSNLSIEYNRTLHPKKTPRIQSPKDDASRESCLVAKEVITHK